MADKHTGPGEAELFALLLEKKLLSSAQIEVAKIDIAATGMNAIDVLLARKWISEDDLPNFTDGAAPKPAVGKPDTSSVGSDGSSKAGSMPNSSTNSVASNKATSNQNNAGAASSASNNSEQTYLDNLKKYRQLMAKIMGEAG